MAPTDQPLLSRERPPSEASVEQEEEVSLLTGRPKLQHKRDGWSFWREVGFFVWAVAATAVVIVLAVLLQHQQHPSSRPADGSSSKRPAGKRNLIFMVSDGMGPVSLSLTRSFRKVAMGNLPDDDVLSLDTHLIGSSRTKSSSSLITDSAAGATAFSCGYKSYNGAISMFPDGAPCGTVLEAAKKAGYLTGLVVTTRITDATPACFASHVKTRGEEDAIAEQLIGHHPLGRMVDLILGGGRCHFLPKGTDGSCRADNVNVIDMARNNSFTYIHTREEFDELKMGANVKLPLIGLFAPTDIPFEIDRRNQDDKYPSLVEMAQTAMHALQEATKHSEKGFFLLIEGSRIDHAGHGNDPAAQVHEVLAYDRTFASVLNFLEDTEVDGVAVSTSDHETGGLAVARQLHYEYPEYLWHPSALANATASAEELTKRLMVFDGTKPSSTQRRAKVLELVFAGLGIHDSTDAEIDHLASVEDYLHVAYGFADLISRRAQNGWSTHGHSAADVNIYSSDSEQTAELRGNRENTEVGQFLANYLEVDVPSITRELQEKKFYTGEFPEGSLVMGPDHYEGDFRRRELECTCGSHH